jgi:hypothetical protein
MSKKMAGIIIAYGFVLFFLGLLTSRLFPTHGNTPFLAGAIGGGLCGICGVAAFAGWKSRALVTIFLAGIAFVFLAEAVGSWFGDYPMGFRLLIPLGLVVTVGALVYVLHGERPPGFYDTRTKAHAPAKYPSK